MNTFRSTRESLIWNGAYAGLLRLLKVIINYNDAIVVYIFITLFL